MKKVKLLNIRISEDLLNRFSEYCTASDTNKSEVLINFIKSLVDGKDNVKTEVSKSDLEDLGKSFEDSLRSQDEILNKILERLDILEAFKDSLRDTDKVNTKVKTVIEKSSPIVDVQGKDDLTHANAINLVKHWKQERDLGNNSLTNQDMADRLNKIGYPTKSGREWSRDMVAKIKPH